MVCSAAVMCSRFFDRGLYDDADACLRVLVQPMFQGGEALVEVAFGLRHVEDVQVDATPVAVSGAHGGGGVFELAAARYSSPSSGHGG